MSLVITPYAAILLKFRAEEGVKGVVIDSPNCSLVAALIDLNTYCDIQTTPSSINTIQATSSSSAIELWKKHTHPVMRILGEIASLKKILLESRNVDGRQTLLEENPFIPRKSFYGGGIFRGRIFERSGGKWTGWTRRIGRTVKEHL